MVGDCFSPKEPEGATERLGECHNGVPSHVTLDNLGPTSEIEMTRAEKGEQKENAWAHK